MFCKRLAHPKLSERLAIMMGFASDGDDNGDDANCGGHLVVQILTKWQHGR